MSAQLDAVIVGAGPNGLSAALTLARAGCSVLVLEQASTIGGGTRTAELTLPGFRHDVCSAIHPFGAASPAFAEHELERYGLEWIHPEVLASHPLDGGGGGALLADIHATGATLGVDAKAYTKRMSALVGRWPRVAPSVFGPLVRLPPHPLAVARSLLPGTLPATTFAKQWFDGDAAQALFAGAAAHSYRPSTSPFTAGVGTTFLTLAHTTGWPVIKGGSQAIANAYLAAIVEHGGEVVTDTTVSSVADLPSARTVFFDTTANVTADIVGDELPRLRRRRLDRFRPGPGAWKIDYALSGPIPFDDELSRRAGTVHLGGTMAEIAAAEAAINRGDMPDRPFVLVTQQSLVDPSRAPAGQHTAWVYGHVPHGFQGDATAAVEAQVERFAPGFREQVLAKAVRTPADLEADNPNQRGGDITGGSIGGDQLVRRPFLSANPYSLGRDGWYMCSSSTPPGAGVHGMCGWHAATRALKSDLRDR